MENKYEVKREGDKQPHYIPVDPEGGCMGQGTGGFWRQFVNASNGETISGTGDTPEKAILDAHKSRTDREFDINKDPREVIKTILGETYPSGVSQTQQDFNRAVARLLGIIP